MTIPRRVPSFASSSKFDFALSPVDRTTNDNSSRNKDEDPAVVNARIEAQLKRDTEAYRKEESRLFKILLLGQAASGKSTTLKNFRMQFTRDEWDRERLGWRAIIQLNIVRQILSIIQILESEMGELTTTENSKSRDVVDCAVESWISGPNGSIGASATPAPLSTEARSQFPEKHRNLIMRLGPRMTEIERVLKSRLTLHTSYYPTLAAPVVSATPFDPGEELDDDILVRKKVVEYTFRSWRDVLDAAPRPSVHSTTTLAQSNGHSSKPATHSVDGLDMPTQAIADLREDIISLWADADVRAIVKRRRMEIPDSTGL
ncbi:hypothetical protein NP233_g11308 [Leucocoprinus birnbaumii]|uniref:Uncharacterized protein n=1 Tax=Leucocoprinus birnbaumii TaxID=56174 RepID=A0AAD5YR35_9AGAR|nr:hypothetical protein NP233_g11308 [Leucocoprinus birnbaumii]